MMEKRVLLSSIIVNSTADTLFPVGSAKVSLRNAVVVANAATEPTTISFDSSVFSGKKTIVLGGSQLEFTNTSQPTTVIGTGARTLFVSAADVSRVIEIKSGVRVGLSGMTLTHGNVYSDTPDYTVPYSSAGGAILNQGTLNLNSMVITENRAGGAGGGGIANFGTAELRAVTISNNSATAVNWDYGNTGDGGGLLDSGTAKLVLCTVSGNSVGEYSHGGGIYVSGDAVSLELNQVTITNNSAYGGFCGGGGLGVSNPNGSVAAIVTIASSIVAGNHLTSYEHEPDMGMDVSAGPFYSGAGVSAGAIVSKGSNLIGMIDGSVGWQSTDQTGTLAWPLDPKLSALTDNGGPTPTHMLQPGSPALNKIPKSALPAGTTTDQRGYWRFVNGLADIGAIERQAAIALPAAPTTLQASATPQQSIQLSWVDKANNEEGYRIERATSDSGPWTEIAIAPCDSAGYLAGGLGANTTYYFRTRATNIAGASAFSNIASARTFGLAVAGQVDPSFGAPGVVSPMPDYGVYEADGAYWSGRAHYTADGINDFTSPTPTLAPYDSILEAIILSDGYTLSGPVNTGSPTGILLTDGRMFTCGTITVEVEIGYGEDVYLVDRSLPYFVFWNADGSLDQSYGRGVSTESIDAYTEYYISSYIAGPYGSVLVEGTHIDYNDYRTDEYAHTWELRPADYDGPVGGADWCYGPNRTAYASSAWSQSSWCAMGMGCYLYYNPAYGVGEVPLQTRDNIDSVGVPLVAALPDGSGAIVAATLTHGSSARPNQILVARFNNAGTVDPTFGDHGVALFSFGKSRAVLDVAVQNDGKVVLVGAVDSGGFVARLSTDGTLDPSFGTAGMVRFSSVDTSAVAITPTGCIQLPGMRLLGDAGSISGTLFDDKNANGTRDASEGVLAFSTVYDDKNNNGKLDIGEQGITSDANGKYTLITTPGVHHIRKYLRPGYQVTVPVGGVYVLALSSGQTITGKDFGHTPFALTQLIESLD